MSDTIPKKWCLDPHAIVANAVGRCSEAGKECNENNTNSSGICVVPVLPENEVLVQLHFYHEGSPKLNSILYAGTVSTLWNSSLFQIYNNIIFKSYLQVLVLY